MLNIAVLVVAIVFFAASIVCAVTCDQFEGGSP
jgi:hypothetical protein